MRGLLDRVAAGSGGRGPDTVESIVANLRVLLNTRCGGSLSAADLGIPDFSDLVHGFPDALALLRQAVKATITQYEPRLKNVAVRQVAAENPLKICLEITGQISQRSGNRVLHLRTEVGRGGRIEIG